MLPRAVTRVGLLATFDSPSANPLDSSLVGQMQGGQPTRKSSFYAVIDYVRHRLNFSAAATWIRGLLPMNHVGGATALSSSKTVWQHPFPLRQLVARRPDRRSRGNGSQHQLPTIQHTRPIELSCPLSSAPPYRRSRGETVVGVEHDVCVQ